MARVAGAPGTVASVERREQSEAPPLLYDLTSLQRDANRRFGFAASRTLRAAQSLYEDKKALTYPRTSSRYLPADLIPQLKPTAEALAPLAPVRRPRPLRPGPGDAAAAAGGGRRQGGRPPRHHPHRRGARRGALQPGRAAHLRPRGAALPGRLPPPGALRPHDRHHRRWRSETFRTQGRVTLEAGWRAVYGAVPDETGQPAGGRGGASAASCRRWPRDSRCRCAEAASEQRTTTPPPRYNEATLLSAMETAGRAGRRRGAAGGAEGARAGHPGHPGRDHRDADPAGVRRAPRRELTPTPKGMQVITLLGRPPPDLGRPDRRLGAAPARDGAGPGRPPRLHARASSTSPGSTVEQIANLDPGTCARRGWSWGSAPAAARRPAR